VLQTADAVQRNAPTDLPRVASALLLMHVLPGTPLDMIDSAACERQMDAAFQRPADSALRSAVARR